MARSLPVIAAAALALFPVACSTPGDHEARPATSPPTPPADARIPDIDAAPPDRARVNTPSSSFHLDSDLPAPTPPPVRPPRGRPRAGQHTIQILLKSSPPGAAAAVDGNPAGNTPTYWQGPVTGKPREFTFVLPGYTMARYRFVPVADGVVHATLVRLASEPADAGPP